MMYRIIVTRSLSSVDGGIREWIRYRVVREVEGMPWDAEEMATCPTPETAEMICELLNGGAESPPEAPPSPIAEETADES